MGKTFFIITIALRTMIGGAADASESSSTRTFARNVPRLLRSAATTGSLPRFPEEPLKSRLDVNPFPRPPTRLIAIGQVVKNVADNRLRISVGRDDGFQVGHELDVYRDEKKIARIVIREVEKVEAIAEVLPKSVVEAPRKGDGLRFNTADAKR